jgi:hypothetical protein
VKKSGKNAKKVKMGNSEQALRVTLIAPAADSNQRLTLVSLAGNVNEVDAFSIA